jgi:hypothetical protein
MGKKKEIIGNTIEVEMPPTEAPKKKREISDKQRENLSKGMAILKAKRESKAKKDDEPAELPPTPVAPAPAPPPAPAPAPPPPEQPKVVKERKPRVVKNYLTTEDFNSFKSELLTSLRPNKDPQERYVAPTPTPSAAPSTTKERVISGSELLNKIFF